MSAFFGAIHPASGHPQHELVEQACRYLGRIGPDAQSIETLGSACFGHCLLRATDDQRDERQPLRNDDAFLLTGDVRLDDRETLARQLGAGSPESLRSMPDIDLIRFAWLRWGEDLTSHIRGDFSFALWDARRQAVFVARDPFGIGSLYYMLKDGAVYFSNALNALLRIPGCDRTPDDAALCDYLLFHYSLEPERTAFRNLRQLAPGHKGWLSGDGTELARYWSLPIEEPVRYKEKQQYTEALNNLLERSVADRLRCGKASVFISGGMDSTTVAAKLRQALGDITARDSLLLASAQSATEDAEIAGRTAGLWGTRFTCVKQSLNNFYRVERDALWPAPGPWWHAESLLGSGVYAEVSGFAPVAMTGQGGDAVFLPNYGHMMDLLRNGQWLAWFKSLFSFYAMHRRRPPLGIQASLRRRLHAEIAVPMPPWIDQDLGREYDLPGRYRDYVARFQGAPKGEHPYRPEAALDLGLPSWPSILGGSHSQVTGAPLSVRHPFFDLRIISFMLRIEQPHLLHRKALLRETMQGQLPAEILDRPKTIQPNQSVRNSILDFCGANESRIRAQWPALGGIVNPGVYARLFAERERLTTPELRNLVSAVYLADWRQALEGLSAYGELA